MYCKSTKYPPPKNRGGVSYTLANKLVAISCISTTTKLKKISETHNTLWNIALEEYKKSPSTLL